jgi:hypothetical protein
LDPFLTESHNKESFMPKFVMGRDWTCDGKVLKPKSGASFSNTWVFDGKELKSKSGASHYNTWVLEGGKLKPKGGASHSNTWDIGNAPLLAVFGSIILRLY